MPNAQKLWQDFVNSDEKNNARPRAVRQFVGRGELLQLYFGLKDRAQEEQFEGCYVVNFYGEPGIGKSTLLQQIEARLQTEAKALAKKKRPVILRADFDSPGLSSVQDVLSLFRAQILSQLDDAAFPFFDMAIHLLIQKQGRRLLPDEEKKSLMDNPVLSFAMGSVADMAGLGTVLGAFQAVFKVKDSVANLLRSRKDSIRRTYREIQQLDAPGLIRRLPYYFAMDVNATRDLPMLCVFLDTYERAAGQADSAGYNAGFDESWLTGRDGLIANLGNAVFAIAGREPLPCEEGDDWHIIRMNADTGEREGYQRKLNMLSVEECKELLTGCGLSSELTEAVCRLTGGDPVFVELCLDQYDHLIAAGETPSVEDFNTNTTRLVERHIRYLPAHLREPLFLLAAMGQWTNAQYDAVREAAKLLYYPISTSVDYCRLTGLSYVRPAGDGWVMQGQIADVLSKELTSGFRGNVLNKIISLASAEETAFHLRPAQAWYAMACHMWETHRDALPFSEQCTFLRNWGDVCDELQELTLDESEKQRLAEAGETAWTLMQEQCENEQKEQGEPTPDFCRAQYELGRHYWQTEDQWEQSIPYFQQAAQGYRELGKIWSINALLAEGALQAAYDRPGAQDTGSGSDDYVWEYTWTGTESAEDLELLQEWAYFWLNSRCGSIDGYYSLMRKIAGAYLVLGGKPSRSVLTAEIQTIGLYVPRQFDPQRYAEFSLLGVEDSKTDGREWDWDIPLFRNDDAAAETAKTCMELVERAKRILSPADPLVAFALDALAQAQEGQCLYHLAIPIRQEALGLLIAAYGPGAKTTLRQEQALVDAYQRAGKVNEAIRLQQNRLEREKEKANTLRQKTELTRTAGLYRYLLSRANGDGQIRKCFAALNGLLEDLRALPGTVSEENVVPWGRAAIWCLNHAERDLEPDTERFVSAVVAFCGNMSRSLFCPGDDRTVAQVILEGMEEESGWRYDLWENYQPDNG